MKERTKTTNLSHFLSLEEMLKSVHVRISPLELPPIPSGNAKSYQEELNAYNPEEFYLIIQNNSIPCMLINARSKTAKAYPSRHLLQRLSGDTREKSKSLIGIYRESLNILRRNGYQITYQHIIGPQELEIIT